MRNVAFLGKSLVLLASLATLFSVSAPTTTFASSTSISAVPGAQTVVIGTWTDSGVTLAEDVPASLHYTSILISDDSLLRVGWMVKVDAEYMLILDLIDGAPHQPDTMVVDRLAGGSVIAPHPNGRMIKAKTVKIEIYANQVTDPEGLGVGAFTLYVTLPDELEYVKLWPSPTWLGSTQRDVWCDGPFHTEGSSIWQVSCSTTGSEPLGPRSGGGLLATLVVLPTQTPKLSTIDLNNSRLFNIASTQIPATVQNAYVRMINCPDTNLDGRVNIIDNQTIAKNPGDRGVDTGVVLVSGADASQTSLQISDQSLLQPVLPLNTLSIEAEILTLQDLQEGSPDTMTVARAASFTTAKPHAEGKHVYRGTFDNFDGKYGYTITRDFDQNGIINIIDAQIVAKSSGMFCTEP